MSQLMCCYGGCWKPSEAESNYCEDHQPRLRQRPAWRFLDQWSDVTPLTDAEQALKNGAMVLRYGIPTVVGVILTLALALMGLIDAVRWLALWYWGVK